MFDFTAEERVDALRVVTTAIRNCQKMQIKFKSGTPQHSLLRSRIRALQIAAALLADDGTAARYTAAELEQALPPLESIRCKTTVAQSKYAPDSTQFKRFRPTIRAMEISIALVEESLTK